MTMPRRQRAPSMPGPDGAGTDIGSGLLNRIKQGSGAPQTLILADFPSVAEIKILGPNSGTANRYALGKARKAVQARVFVQVLRQGIRPVPPPVHVTLRYVVPDARHRDADNFTVIGKPVIDGLVKGQILAGDDAARLTPRVEFVKRAGQRRLEIVLAPREDER